MLTAFLMRKSDKTYVLKAGRQTACLLITKSSHGNKCSKIVKKTTRSIMLDPTCCSSHAI